MSNFQCPHCGMTNIDCGKDGYKTPREIELENKLKIAEEALQIYANSVMPDNLYTSKNMSNSAIYTDNWCIKGEFNEALFKVHYDTEIAQKALQKIKEK